MQQKDVWKLGFAVMGKVNFVVMGTEGTISQFGLPGGSLTVGHIAVLKPPLHSNIKFEH